MKKYYYATAFTGFPYLVNGFIISRFIKVINRLPKLPNFFWKLLIFRCSIETVFLSKHFRFCEDFGSKTMRISEIKSIKEIFFRILTIIIQYSLEMECFECDIFELFFPSVSLDLETHHKMLK